MALIYVCCFWFSLRLGALLSAIISALKAICLLIVLLQEEVAVLMNTVEKFLLVIDFNKFIVKLVAQDFKILFGFLTSYFGVYCLVSILLGVGALQCNPMLCYPFIVSHILMMLLDLLLYTVLFKYLMLLAFVPIDEHHSYNIGLAEAIVYLTFGIFYVFYDIYLVVCICSFVDVVKSLRTKMIRKSLQPAFPIVIVKRDKHGLAPIIKFDSPSVRKTRF